MVHAGRVARARGLPCVAARGAFGCPFECRESATGLPFVLGGDCLDARTRDRARGRPRGQRERLHHPRSTRLPGGLRQVGGIGAGDAALPGASEHRLGEARIGVASEELRARAGGQPGTTAGPKLSRGGGTAADPAAGAPALLLPRRGWASQKPCELFAGGGGLLRAGAHPHRGSRQGSGQLRPGGRGKLDHSGGGHARLPGRRIASHGHRAQARIRGMAGRAAPSRRRAGTCLAGSPQRCGGLPLRGRLLTRGAQTRSCALARREGDNPNPAGLDDGKPGPRGLERAAGWLGFCVAATGRNPPEHAGRPAGARNRTQSGVVARAREDIAAVPPGTARRPHGSAQSHPGDGPCRADHRSQRPSPGDGRRGPIHRRRRVQVRQ